MSGTPRPVMPRLRDRRVALTRRRPVRNCRVAGPAGAPCKSTPPGLASWGQNEQVIFPPLPVTVTQLPVTSITVTLSGAATGYRMPAPYGSTGSPSDPGQLVTVSPVVASSVSASSS
jgi:hypothetical protein